MSLSPVLDTFIKRRDIYKRKLTSALNCINAREILVKNSFLTQKKLAMNWLASVNMNEEILKTFIGNEVDAEIIDKESEQEISFNLFILNKLAVCEKLKMVVVVVVVVWNHPVKLSSHISSMKWPLN